MRDNSLGRHAVEVGGRTLTFKKAAICTGARAAAPSISGLREAGYLTNETVFDLTELPRRLAVIGAGPIGCELSQAFTRFGSEVSVFEQNGRILSRGMTTQPRSSGRKWRTSGISFLFNAKVLRVEQRQKEKVFTMNERARRTS